jgi:hypothetical protein
VFARSDLRERLRERRAAQLHVAVLSRRRCGGVRG